MEAPITAGAGGAVAATEEIPNKLYFRIGDVSRIVGVKPYVLRYWETEFPAISPRKGSSGQRLYRRKDVEIILRIKHLLYDKRYTIEGARKALSSTPGVVLPPAAQQTLFASDGPDLEAIREELRAILMLLDRDL